MPGGLHPPPTVLLQWTELASDPHPQSSAGRHGIVAMSCVLTVLAILVVMARLRARWLRKNFDWDDGLLLVAMVRIFIFLICFEAVLQMRSGEGKARLWILC